MELTLKLGTRKSALAQAQAGWVAERLRAAFPDIRVELVLMTTSGDKDSRRQPHSSGGLKALFTKEIEEALLHYQVDLAVHSLKDMAAEIPKGLQIGAVPQREDPRDVWISSRGAPLKSLGAKPRIGTTSVRRQAQLKHLRPDCEFIPLRGNVDSRLQKLREEHLDGIVLAMAGLKRLGRDSECTEVLSPDLMLPAVGQGCLGIECRTDDASIMRFVKALDHAPSHQASLAERAFLRALGGSCQTPIAGYAEVAGPELRITGLVVDPSGEPLLRARESSAVGDAEQAGQRLAQKLLADGADKILQ